MTSGDASRTAIGVVAAAAARYGYTLTIWNAAAIASHAAGAPGAFEAVLFLLGALVAFACVGPVANGRVDALLSSPPSREIRFWALSTSRRSDSRSARRH